MSHDLTPREQELFAALPREMPLEPTSEHGLFSVLRSEGYFDRHHQRAPLRRIAAAIALVLGGSLAGFLVGERVGQRASVEAQLARDNLTSAERVLLLQRAGSAYVNAAHAYADAAATTDSAAVEVARQVLLGAAHALVRSDLDAGVAATLTSVLRTPVTKPTAPARPNVPSVIWY